MANHVGGALRFIDSRRKGAADRSQAEFQAEYIDQDERQQGNEDRDAQHNHRADRLVEPFPLVSGGIHTERNADQQRNEKRCADKQQRPPQPGSDDGADGLLVEERLAQFEAGQIAQVQHILLEQRFVQPQQGVERLYILGRHGVADKGRGRVAGHQPHDQEGDRDGGKKGQPAFHDPQDDVLEHAWLAQEPLV